MNLPYKHEDYQIRDLEHLFRLFKSKQKEAVILRSRGASKTNDTMKFCLYLIYLGFEVIYFTANASQMERPKIYMKDLISRSFLKWCLPDKNSLQKEKVEFAGSGLLTILNLTESKAISPRADVIVFDEERKADPDAYNNTHGIFADTNIAFTLHISTAEKGTIFEDNTDYLLSQEAIDNEKYVLITLLYDVDFLWNKRREHYLKLKEKLPAWLWDQEFECKFTLPHGAVFKNIEFGPIPNWLWEQVVDSHECNGIDWNPVSHHWLVGGKWTPDMRNFVFTRCDDLGQGYAVDMNEDQFKAIASSGTQGRHVTMEKSGINEEYIKWFRKMLSEVRIGWGKQQFHYEEWDSQGIEKHKIILYIVQNGITLWIDKSKYPFLAKEFEDCRWDPDSEKPRIVKKAASSPHRFEAGLHAMSDKNRSISEIEVSRFY